MLGHFGRRIIEKLNLNARLGQAMSSRPLNKLKRIKGYYSRPYDFAYRRQIFAAFCYE